jgi:2-methylisocitrate lyase-like PEP mutase family enzyme
MPVPCRRIGLRDVVDHVRHIAARTTIPIFVDADTGFGNAVNVHYTVGELVRSGVAGMQIEDQESPKKSGTLAGRRCIPLGEAVGKIRAAVEARDEIDPSFVICARCDELGAEGGTFESTVERCVAYVSDGGADLVRLKLRPNARATPRDRARGAGSGAHDLGRHGRAGADDRGVFATRRSHRALPDPYRLGLEYAFSAKV